MMMMRMDVKVFWLVATILLYVCVVVGPSGWRSMWWQTKRAWKGNGVTRDELVEDTINFYDSSLDKVFSGMSPSSPVGPCDECGADLPKITGYDDPRRKNKALDMMSYLYINPDMKPDDKEELCEACYDKLSSEEQRWYASIIRMTNREADAAYQKYNKRKKVN